MIYVVSRTSRRVCLAILVATLAAVGSSTPLQSQASSPCGTGINAIVCENLQAGDPASAWDISGIGDATIQGYATDISVNHGTTVQFKIKTDAASYHLDIYRMGFYNGLGARKVATVLPSATLPQTQPACLTDPATGLIDCGNWAVSASWNVPANAVSGIYFAKAIRDDNGGASHIVFIVRDDDGHSDLLFQTSDTTWQAYNTYGGNSLYVGQPAGRAYKVSYNRPYNNRITANGGLEGWLFSNEYPMVRWLESNGYNVSYTTGLDTERRGAELLEHHVFMSVGHDEYWSGAQRANVEAARDAGVNLAFFSGNEIFWKTRWENSIAGGATPYRTLVSYKETHANAKIDPTAAWTGSWRDPRFSPPADGGRPENSLSGTLFMVNGTRTDPMTVTAAQGAMRFWRNTSVALLPPGQIATFAAGILGYEWDEAPDNGFQPRGLQRLSSTTIDVSPLYLQDYGSTYGSGTATHSMTMYRAPSGALVFGAGTVQYSWLLDATHDRVGPAADPRLQQATINLFADMGVQPGSLQSGLVAASASLDSTPPTSTITAPANGATVQSGTAITISGTASDAGGGVVANVEVSTDGGTTWRRATGTTAWTLSWTPTGPGSTSVSANIRSRAYDDSGNAETPAAGATVTIAPLGGLVASYGFNEGSGTVVADVSGGGNTGTVTGATWTTGRLGGGLLFNGTTNWVTVNDSAALDLTNAMTLEAWVNPSASNGWRNVLLKEAPPLDLAYGLYANENVARPDATIHTGASDSVAAGTAGLPLNAWTHLAGTYDGTTLRLYVNGVQVTQTAVTGALTNSASPLRIGGNNVWGEYFAGIIDEVRIYRRALSPSEIQADMTAPVGGGPLPDTTAPTVSVTAPVAGATVNGMISVSANAADNVGVAGVQFLLDGASLGTEDTTAPYSVSWITTSVADGTHVLSARARDAAGNTGVAANVTVTVSNTPDTQPPTVSITAPAAGATVSATTSISANASDNVAVAGVTFLVDNVQVGSEVVAAPYAVAWNTTTVGNGTHLLTARARDGAGHTTTSAAVSVTVSNTAQPVPGLVAAYAFDEGTGTTTNDASGVGNTGTTSATTWIAGHTGNALSFDGASSWVTIPDSPSLDLTTGMTVEAWVKPTALSGWRCVVLKETALTPQTLAYGLYANNNAPQPAATIRAGAADSTATGTAGLALNAWTHVAMTYDGATLRMFVNAVQVGSTPVTGAMVTSASPLRIGGNSMWGEYFSGAIDDVRVYNRALSTTEVQTDMNTPVTGTGGDKTPPTVLSTTPAAGATSVGASATVRATFSEPLNPATIDASRFTLQSAAGPVSATVAYDAASKTATLTPSARLPFSTTFTATLVGGASGITDSVGNPLAANVTWSFTTGAAGFEDTVVMTGLTEPTAIDFAADGRIFVAEKRGVIKVYQSLTDTSPTVFADLRTNVYNFWDRGLLGLALDPNFPTKPYVYVLYTYDAAIGGTAPRWGAPGVDSDPCPSPPGPTADGCIVSGRLSRLQAAGNVMTGAEQVLIEDWPQQFPSHSIGTIQFGPDGALYVSAGEGANFNAVDYGNFGNPVNPFGDPPSEGGALRAQDLTTPGDPVTLDGSVLRVDPNTGAAMPDNPLFANADPNARRIIAHGVRNPFRFTFKPGTSEIYIGDVGWNDVEEINRIPNAADAVVENFGWPCYEGSGKQSGYDAAGLNICKNLYAQPGAVTMPFFSYAHSNHVVAGEGCTTGGSSISGVAFYNGGNYPAAYQNALFFADYSRNCIWVMFNGPGGIPDPTNVATFRDPASEPVQLKIGPAGDLFYVDLGGTIHRVQYYEGNLPPKAAISASPVAGPTPLTVNFSGSASTDPDGNPLTYAWDLDNDGLFNDGTGVTATFTYSTAGAHIARLRVTDSGGLTDVASVTITGNSTPPVPEIQTPVSSTTWRVGDLIAFSGRATDPEEGTLPASALTWDLTLHHCALNGTCHIHPLQTYAGVASGSFVAPDHEYPSYLELTLTATDSSGLSTSTSVRLDPQTTTLSFDTQPSGMSLAVGSTASVTPFTRTVIIGSTNSLSAPSPTTFNGSSYEFLSWSDGGAATHTVVAGSAPASYSARYSVVPSMSIGDASITETPGGANISFTVTLDQPSAQTVTASYATANGTATAGADYTGQNGAVTFAPNTTTATIIIPISDDALNEANETFFVNLSNPVHAAIATAQATGTIIDNDPPPALSIDDVTVNEGNSGTTNASFTVRLSSASGQGVSFGYATANGTATAGSDFTSTSGTATIPAGTTSTLVQVPIIGDATIEPDETFTLTLSSVTNAVIGDGQATGTIKNDDTTIAGLIASYGFNEGSGTTTADVSGKGHVGTVSGATWTATGKNGKALSFNGTSSYVSVADANDLDLTTGMTLEAWVRPSTLSGWNTVVMKEGTATSLAYSLYANDGSPWPSLTVRISNTDREAAGTSQVPLNTWTHLAATYDGTTMRVYMNGIQVGSRAQTGSMLVSTRTLRIGGNSVWGEYFNGLIDDVRVYNRALSAAEIQSDMNTPVQ